MLSASYVAVIHFSARFELISAVGDACELFCHPAEAGDDVSVEPVCNSVFSEVKRPFLHLPLERNFPVSTRQAQSFKDA
jgi:hypothetical protein